MNERWLMQISYNAVWKECQSTKVSMTCRNSSALRISIDLFVYTSPSIQYIHLQNRFEHCSTVGNCPNLYKLPFFSYEFLPAELKFDIRQQRTTSCIAGFGQVGH